MTAKNSGNNMKTMSEKNKRIVCLTKSPIGVLPNTKISYPKRIRSKKYQYNDYQLKGFYLESKIIDPCTKKEEPFQIHIWSFTNDETMEEYLAFKVEGIPIMLNEDNDTIRNNGGVIYPVIPGRKKVPHVRHLLCPHRTTLDRHHLSVSIFKKDHYIGVPICFLDRFTNQTEKNWFFFYHVEVDGKRGLAFEFQTATPVLIDLNYNDIHFYCTT